MGWVVAVVVVVVVGIKLSLSSYQTGRVRSHAPPPTPPSSPAGGVVEGRKSSAL